MQPSKSFRRPLARLVCLLAMLIPVVAQADSSGVDFSDNVNYTAIANDPVPQIIKITGSVLNTNPFPLFTTLMSASDPVVCPGCFLDLKYNDSGGGKLLGAGLGTGDITLATLYIPAHELPSGGSFFYDSIFLSWVVGNVEVSTGGAVVTVVPVPATAVPEPSSLILLGTVLPLFGVVIRKKFATFAT